METKRQRREWAQRTKTWSGVKTSAEAATGVLADYVDDVVSPVRFRRGFSCLSVRIADPNVSDRNAPPRDLRPPATRLITSRGIALQFALIAFAVTQQGNADLPIRPRSGDARGWTDLVASPVLESRDGSGILRGIPEKKRQQIKTALKSMSGAGLVHLGASGREYEGFQLYEESGVAERGDLIPYKPPKRKEPNVFSLPRGFMTNGWVHVLTDSELAVVLMLSCRVLAHEGAEPGFVWFEASDRVLHYGLGRESFGPALKPLEKLGLLEVRSINRHPDGHVIGFSTDGLDARPHRLRLIKEGFDEPAWQVAAEVFG